MEELNDRRETDRTSLGIFKPKKVRDLVISADDPDWKASFKAALQQARLWEDRTVSKAPPRKAPFKFHYQFECDDPRCKEGHKMMIEDWEVGALFWRLADQALSHKDAAAKVKEKFLGELCGPDKDTHYHLWGPSWPIRVPGWRSGSSTRRSSPRNARPRRSRPFSIWRRILECARPPSLERPREAALRRGSGRAHGGDPGQADKCRSMRNSGSQNTAPPTETLWEVDRIRRPSTRSCSATCNLAYRSSVGKHEQAIENRAKRLHKRAVEAGFRDWIAWADVVRKRLKRSRKVPIEMKDKSRRLGRMDTKKFNQINHLMELYGSHTMEPALAAIYPKITPHIRRSTRDVRLLRGAMRRRGCSRASCSAPAHAATERIAASVISRRLHFARCLKSFFPTNKSVLFAALNLIVQIQLHTPIV